MIKEKIYKIVNGERYQVGYKENKIIYLEFQLLLRYFNARGKQFDRNFQIYEKDIPVYKLCFEYFSKNVKYCEENNIDLNKGLLLYGKNGVGKTVILFLFQELLQSTKNPMKFYPMKQLSSNAGNGTTDLKKILDFNKDVVLDDIGSEPPSYYYADKFEVFDRVISYYEEFNYALMRPDQFGFIGEILSTKADSKRSNSKNPKRLHATTNLDLIMIRERYGQRVESRISSFFNCISFPSQEDKRKANANVIQM